MVAVLWGWLLRTVIAHDRASDGVGWRWFDVAVNADEQIGSHVDDRRWAVAEFEAGWSPSSMVRGWPCVVATCWGVSTGVAGAVTPAVGVRRARGCGAQSVEQRRSHDGCGTPSS